MPRWFRLMAFVSCLVLLGVGCRRGRPAATEEPTLEPEPTPSAESLGEFQLVARVEQAFLSIGPDIDIPPGEGTPPDEATAGGRETPDVEGVMRAALDAFSDNLGDRCFADEGDRFNLFWTENTLFDPALLDGGLEAELDGRRLGIIGTIFLKPTEDGEVDEDFGFDTPSPDAAEQDVTPTPQTLPGATTGEGEDRCVLIAEQVGTSSGELPTPRPTRSPGPRTPTPSPTATRSPTPRPTTPAPTTPAPTDTFTAPPTTAPPTASPTSTPIISP